MWRFGFVIATLLTGAVAAQAVQTPPPSRGVIAGRVVDARTWRPLRGVMVSSPVLGFRQEVGVITNESGEFAFRNVPAGNYTVVATKAGYFEGAYGRRRIGPDLDQVVMTDGARVEGIEILLWPQASISGVLTGASGDPIAGAYISAVPLPHEWGENIVPPVRTDEAGRYFIERLQPGDYLVGTQMFYDFLPRGGIVVSGVQVPTTFMLASDKYVYQGVLYPSATSPERAATISVASGDDRIGVDLRVPLVPVVRVSGKAVTPGGPAGGALMVLSNATVSAQAFAAADGSFSFDRVPAGAYLLRGMSASVDPRTADVISGAFSVSMPVVVSESGLSDVIAQMARNGRNGPPHVSGVLQLEGRDPSVTMGITIDSPSRAQASRIPPQSYSAGPFDLTMPLGGRIRLRPSAVPNWTVDAVLLNGREVTDAFVDLGPDGLRGLTIRLVQQTTRVSGRVTDPRGGPMPNAAVVVFPANPADWTDDLPPAPVRFQRVRPRVGAYEITGLPAGDYLIAAVDDLLLDSWPRIQGLQTLAVNAEHLHVEWGSAIERNFRVSNAR